MKRLCCLLAALMVGTTAMAVEEPKFETVLEEANFEVRQYGAFIVAETWVDGDMDAASGRGFRRIADYIFGNNTASDTATREKIAMTAPVTMQPQSRGDKHAMAAPVPFEPASEPLELMGAQRWRMRFVMPSQYSMATLPTPNDEAIMLRKVPARRVAVARYSGLNTERRIEQQAQALLVWMRSRQLLAAGPAQLARYDPPWIPPFWRRNEIHIPIDGEPAR